MHTYTFCTGHGIDTNARGLAKDPVALDLKISQVRGQGRMIEEVDEEV